MVFFQDRWQSWQLFQVDFPKPSVISSDLMFLYNMERIMIIFKLDATWRTRTSLTITKIDRRVKWGSIVWQFPLQISATDYRCLETCTSYRLQCYPLHHPQYVWFDLGAICLGLGLGLILSAPNYEDVYVRYDNQCTVGQVGCVVTFTVPSDLPAPVYFYYGFKGFYQNHRRYLKFFSSSQLTTGTIDASGVHIL